MRTRGTHHPNPQRGFGGNAGRYSDDREKYNMERSTNRMPVGDTVDNHQQFVSAGQESVSHTNGMRGREDGGWTTGYQHEESGEQGDESMHSRRNEDDIRNEFMVRRNSLGSPPSWSTEGNEGYAAMSDDRRWKMNNMGAEGTRRNDKGRRGFSQGSRKHNGND